MPQFAKATLKWIGIFLDNSNYDAIAFIAYRSAGIRKFHIEYLFVAPEWRRKRLGAYLIRELIEQEQPLFTLTVDATIDMVVFKFYLSRGFNVAPYDYKDTDAWKLAERAHHYLESTTATDTVEFEREFSSLFLTNRSGPSLNMLMVVTDNE
jgi:GNAT superfamily N-acetyltransferase